MNNKKGNEKFNLFKGIILGGLMLMFCGVCAYLLVPEMYSLFMNMLGLSVNLFSFSLIGSGIVLGLIGIGFAVSCVRTKNEYEDMDEDNYTQLVTSELRIVKSDDRGKEKELEVTSSKYGYLFDNNYEDVPDCNEVIDDMTDIDMGLLPGDRLFGISQGISRKKYKGKYLK